MHVIIKAVLWAIIVALAAAIAFNAAFYHGVIVLIFLVLGIIAAVDTIMAITIGEAKDETN